MEITLIVFLKTSFNYLSWRILFWGIARGFVHCHNFHQALQLLSAAANCTSLETLPNKSTQDKLYPPSLILFNCFKLADIQHRSNVFFGMLSADAQVSLSLSLPLSLSLYIYIYIIKGKLYKRPREYTLFVSYYVLGDRKSVV